MKKISRRAFNTSLTLGAGMLLHQLQACDSDSYVDRKLGVALVGLGSYSEYQLGPALLDTTYCQLAAIVTGTPSKEKKWAQKYGLTEDNIYNYENFDEIAKNKNVDIVYVVLPNSMHADFSIRAAKAGKHVIVEKPMAMNVAECDAIINACKENNVKLSVGYRLHSEPFTKEIKKIVKEKTFGEIKYVAADASYFSDRYPNQWRLDRSLSGGGALVNMGVYAIQGAIYGTGQNPTSVSAQEFSTRPEYFKDTDETITAQFEFPNGAVGNIFTSHNVNTNRHYSRFENGWIELSPANNYGPLQGASSSGPFEFQHESQQKLQMDDFAKHILLGTENVVPGEMGKRDMIIVEAIYQSIKEGGRKIPLELGNMGL